MSRRTKLLIAALFLVLGGIPAIYVASVWHPTNPLRFRIEKVQPTAVSESARWREVRVVIENTSGTPIVLNSAELSDGRGGKVGDYGRIFPAIGTRRGMNLFPPRSEVTVTCYVLPAVLGLPADQSFLVHYSWMSQLKAKWLPIHNEIRAHIPVVPGIVPVLPLDEDVTPLGFAEE